MSLSTAPKPNIKKLLKTHFGFDDFLPNQEAIIQNVLQQNDSIAIMPTGGGKSLCYQLSALALEGTAIVISPLISLMKDQVDALKANGILAAYVNSSQPNEERQAVLSQLQQNKLKLLYVAPESLNQLYFVLENLKINLFAIDEAHCISAWGHDFRPAYTQLSQLKEKFPKTPIMALTATADRATRSDIGKQLNTPKAKTFIASFDRPNLYLDVRAGRGRNGQIFNFLEKHPKEGGIIYCLSRKSTEKLASKLQAKGYKAKAYHAGMEAEERTKVQECFINDQTPIVVATIAFGMGIDKSNVRWVIHYNMPKNLEGYYQEIGRAGRDNLPAHTLLFHSYADVILLRKFAEDSAQSEYHLAKLERMQQYAEALSCRRKTLLSYFGEQLSEDCGNCDVCQNPPQYFDGTIIAQKVCSAIARLKEQEPINMVVDVLRGAQNTKVIAKGYQTIKTYGAAKNISWRDLQDYVIQLVNQGVLEIYFHEKGRLVLTPLAKQVLFKGRKIQLAQANQQKNTQRSKTAVHERGALFRALRQHRAQLAKEANVPPYVIFSDAALEDMEERMPRTKAHFSHIYGVGKAKLEKYADDFLEIINHHIQSNKGNIQVPDFDYDKKKYVGTQAGSKKSKRKSKDLFSKLSKRCSELFEKEFPNDQALNILVKEKPRTKEEFSKLSALKDGEINNHADELLKVINRHIDQLENDLPSHEYSYRLFTEEHKSVAEIAVKRGLTENTVMGHLLKMHKAGNSIDLTKFITDAERKQIEKAQNDLDNPETLRPYFDYFNENMSYWKIKLGLYLNEEKNYQH